MILDAYSIAQLQHLAALTQAAEAAGIADLPTLRARLQDHLRLRSLALRVEHRGAERAPKTSRAQASPPCPSCGSIRTKTFVADGLELLGCWDCRYSAIVGSAA